jgi:hypothetical protein
MNDCQITIQTSRDGPAPSVGPSHAIAGTVGGRIDIARVVTIAAVFIRDPDGCLVLNGRIAVCSCIGGRAARYPRCLLPPDRFAVFLPHAPFEEEVE